MRFYFSQKTKLVFTGVILLFFSIGLWGQNETDVLRYSWIDFAGTARFTSTGGAFGALGGDFSTLSQNPGGIGIYRKSEITLTPSFDFSNTDSEFFNSKSESSHLSFFFDQVGYVGVYPINKGKWQNAQFGLGFNRLKNFSNEFTISGLNDRSSVIDVFLNQAQGFSEVDLEDALPFTSDLAYQTYLIDPDTNTSDVTDYVSVYPGGTILQDFEQKTKGRLTETVFSGGANYDNKLYMGLSIGLQGVVFESVSKHTETVQDIAVTDLRNFTYREELNTSGNGINLKTGLIYRFSDFLRIGAAYHSPTWLQLTDEWSTNIISSFDGNINYSYDSPLGLSEYQIRTPHRFIGSVATVIDRKAIISLDYEYVDYSQGELDDRNLSPADFSETNDRISDDFLATSNLRVGAEYRIQPISIRAGWAYYASPLNDPLIESELSKKIYSGGIGYKRRNVSIDLAYRYNQNDNGFYLYDAQLVPPAELSEENHRFAFTFGYRF